MIHLDSILWEAGTFRLENIMLRVPTGQYAVLMGRTGCGKTTLVEILCGLRRPLAGRVLIGDRDVTDDPPGARGVGYVPQDGAMFPTMTVSEHLGFALRLRRRPPEEIAQRVEQLAVELGVAALLDRRPQGLSGGERQRVALGRALAAQPKVLVLDEPLSAIDEDLRDDLASLLRRVQREHGVTALHITHSRAEAAHLADVQFCLADGRITETSNSTPPEATNGFPSRVKTTPCGIHFP